MQGLLAEFQQRLRQASKMPFSPAPAWSSSWPRCSGSSTNGGLPPALPRPVGDPRRDRRGVGHRHPGADRVRARGPHGRSALPADDLVSASTGVLGFALANVELCIAGQVDAETAWRVTCEYATSRFVD